MRRGTPRSISTGLVLFHAGGLITIELPRPEESDESAPGRTATAGRSEVAAKRAKQDVRDAVARSLRWAFPLPESGSFNRLLEALREG